MKKKEKQEFRMKALPEIERLIAVDREKLSELKFDLGAGKVKNIREIRAIKKNIARLLTLHKEKQS